ncbi:DUF4124 domain-containing protein [Thauera mechernichensis]|uniref:DUF4124 domain-containing protein n=1 Tax=Thauera mechernichensis TaxID=82788 RepID=A0ABW3WH98_9RHOO|nr:DUF4124 domain-containing protein [Thauera mechernichensis]MDG3063274.1 DUF4124 domain-containing protein [Thauera mechernichensis]
MKRHILLAAGLLAASAAHAQVYKCVEDGKTVFADRPCAPDAKPMRGLGVPQQATHGLGGAPIDRGRQLCEAQAIPSLSGLYDPSSAIVESTSGGTMDVLDYEGAKIPARTYLVRVNAKNRMGGYVGAKPVICYTSPDGTRLLKINAALLN